MTFGSQPHRRAGRPRTLLRRDRPAPGPARGLGAHRLRIGLEKFALTAVESLARVVAVVKPQSAFFERFGSRGVAVLEQVVAAARQLGCLVLLDVKRGDIGSTAQAYADAYLDKNSPMYVDAVTVSPYLGIGSVDPLVETALANDAGVFLLALVQPGGGRRCSTRSPPTAGPSPGWCSTRWPAAMLGVEGLGSVGAVGATVELPADVGITDLDVGGPLLVPGIGAQGGTIDDVRRVFGAAVRNVLPTSSREILAAGPSRPPCTTRRCRRSTPSAPWPDRSRGQPTRTVRAAHLHHQAARGEEQRRPARVGGRGDQDLARLEVRAAGSRITRARAGDGARPTPACRPAARPSGGRPGATASGSVPSDSSTRGTCRRRSSRVVLRPPARRHGVRAGRLPPGRRRPRQVEEEDVVGRRRAARARPARRRPAARGAPRPAPYDEELRQLAQPDERAGGRRREPTSSGPRRPAGERSAPCRSSPRPPRAPRANCVGREPRVVVEAQVVGEHAEHVRGSSDQRGSPGRSRRPRGAVAAEEARRPRCTAAGSVPAR